MTLTIWKTSALTISAAAALGVLLGRSAVSVSAQSNPAASAEFYTAKVQPILQANCYRCHGGMNHKGGLSMATREGLMKGGHDGAVIVPGDPANSLLIKLIRHEGPALDPMPMPPKSKLSDADIAVVTEWVKAGAVMPPDAPQ
jgi:uncharacterized membrane protein